MSGPQEISYRCFCAVGALSNPRLFSRAIYNRQGAFVRMAYFDSGHGQLSHPGPSLKGPPSAPQT